MAATPVEDDTLKQIHQYVKNMDINSLYVDLTEQMLMYRPENPIRFMVDYLSFKYEDKVSAGSYVRTEDEGKGEEGVKWTWQDRPADEGKGDEGKSGDGLDIESDTDDDDDYIDELPKAKPRRQRGAISAVRTDLSNFEPTKVEKSAAERERILAILSSNNFFSKMTSDQRSIMCDAMKPAEYADGDTIITQGDAGDTFYLLDAGVADVWVAKDGGEPQKVFTYEEGCGAAFGELALMYNAPRAATVKAVGTVKAWALDQMTFKYSMQTDTTEKREQNAKWLSQVPLLSDLEEVEKLTIADALISEPFKAGDTLIRQGDKGDKFYIVKSGVCKCMVATESKSEGVEVLRVKSGGYFGEIALLTNQPRKASVIGVEDGEALTLDRATFKRVMGPLETILQRNLDNYKEVMQKMGL